MGEKQLQELRPSGGRNTLNHVRFRPNLEPFTDGRRAFHLLGLKSRLILPAHYLMANV